MSIPPTRPPPTPSSSLSERSKCVAAIPLLVLPLLAHSLISGVLRPRMPDVFIPHSPSSETGNGAFSFTREGIVNTGDGVLVQIPISGGEGANDNFWVFEPSFSTSGNGTPRVARCLVGPAAAVLIRVVIALDV